jgi:hypothetical protein
MASFLETVYDIMGSHTTKVLFLSLYLIVIGLFFLNQYQSGEETMCKEARFMIARNVEIEYNMRSSGDIESADKLHKSLLNLSDITQDCNFNIKRLLKRKHK